MFQLFNLLFRPRPMSFVFTAEHPVIAQENNHDAQFLQYTLVTFHFNEQV